MEIQYKALVGTGYHTPQEVERELESIVDALVFGGYEPNSTEEMDAKAQFDFLYDLLLEIKKGEQ